jgi:hypothetical protein
MLKISMYNTYVQYYQSVCQKTYMFSLFAFLLSNTCTWGSPQNAMVGVTYIEILKANTYCNCLDHIRVNSRILHYSEVE